MAAKGSWVEQINKRTRTGKKHVDSADPRHFAVDISCGASIHYPDDGWQNIDNEFLPVAAPWNWEMTKAGYHIRVKEDFTAGQIIQFEKQGETVEFQPMALEYTNDLDQIQAIAMPHDVTPVITNPVVDLLPKVGVLSHQGAIRWDDAYGSGIDFEWKCTPSRLAKILEIDSLASLPVPEQYIIDGGNPVLRLNLIFDPSRDIDIFVDGQEWNQKDKIQTFNIIEFRKDGDVLWGFMPLRYWDNGTSPEGNQGQSIATVEKRGGNLYVSIRVPYSWLQIATFPVFIDIDVDEQIIASADDCRVVDGNTDGTYDSIDTTSAFHTMGYLTSTWSWYGVGNRFQTVAIPNSATIGANSYLTFNCRFASSNNDCNVDIFGEDADDAASFSTIGDYNGRGRTASVDWDAIETWPTADVTHDSPSIVAIVQTIVNRGGWATGQDMAFFCENDGSDGDAVRNSDSHDSDSARDAKLHIEYSAAAGWGGEFCGVAVDEFDGVTPDEIDGV